jgi:hypothetical protein
MIHILSGARFGKLQSSPDLENDNIIFLLLLYYKMGVGDGEATFSTSFDF